MAGADTRGTGWDPAYDGPLVECAGRLRFERQFFRADAAPTGADVVICRHVIEHVPEPLALLRDIRQSLSQTPHARVYFETPCVEWILENNTIWDLFYEHCSLFSEPSLRTAFSRSGFAVAGFRHVFGGQYFWVEASVARPKQIRLGHDLDVAERALQFGRTCDGLRHRWTHRIATLAKHQKLAIWGAGAKGVTFANLVDPGRTLIDCVVDMNPRKQGSYLPGTGHPVVDYRVLGSRGVSAAVVMNPQYEDEIRSLLDEENVEVELVSL